MWIRLQESELVVKRAMLPTRVVLERDSERQEYRTYLETVRQEGETTFLYGRIFDDEDQAREDFQRRLSRL